MKVYPGVDGTSSIYEDDGRSFAYRKGQFMRIESRWEDTSRRLRLALAPGSKMMAPLRRQIVVTAAGSAETRTVMFTGKPVEVRL
jgi:hypothetical protein